ncbi:CGNR zinc finger domain-containing protein [Amycolatopsis cihanbeyliensis]|nr:CGNR zinc finger domain-containing protein [Amycolatopsis cihanbeyliensis]
MKGQPGNRAEAPGRLALVQSFVNSVNVEFGPDEFATAEGFRRWLARNELVSRSVEPEELDRTDAIALREAMRALLRENNDAPADPRARRTVRHIARNCPMVVRFAGETGDPELGPAQPDVRGALGTVLAHMMGAVHDGSWQRLKACQEHRCAWAFYDRSRNRASRWCSMSVCGARAKMRVYRQARRAEAGS